MDKLSGEQALIFHLPYKYELNEPMFYLGQGNPANPDFPRKLSIDFAGEFVVTSMESEGTNEIKIAEIEKVLGKFSENVRIIYSGGVATINHLGLLSKLPINGIGLGNILASKEAFVLNAKINCTEISRGIEKDLVR